MTLATNYAINVQSGTTKIYGGLSGFPSWLQAVAANTWAAAPGNTIDSVKPVPTPTPDHPALINAWNGGCIIGDYFYLAACGGHGDYWGNEVYRFGPLRSETPAWSLFRAPSALADVLSDVSEYADGRPVSRHTYATQVGVPALSGSTNGNRIIIPSLSAAWSSGLYSAQDVHSIAADATDWDPVDFFPNSAGDDNSTSCAAWDSGNELLWYSPGNTSINQHLVQPLNVRTKTWGAIYPAAANIGPKATYVNMAYDSTRQELLIFANSSATQWVVDVSNALAPSHRSVTITGPAGTTINDGLEQPAGAGCAYDPVSGNYVLHNGGSRVFLLTPNGTNTWASSEITLAGGGATPPSVFGMRGTFNRFQHVAVLSDAVNSVFIKADSTTGNTYVYKSASGGVA